MDDVVWNERTDWLIESSPQWLVARLIVADY